MINNVNWELIKRAAESVEQGMKRVDVAGATIYKVPGAKTSVIRIDIKIKSTSGGDSND